MSIRIKTYFLYFSYGIKFDPSMAEKLSPQLFENRPPIVNHSLEYGQDIPGIYGCSPGSRSE